MSLPGSATIPATRADRLRAAQESGRQIVRMIMEGITARRIINQKSIENTIRLNAAVGGSTNAILHLLAIAYEADVELDVDRFEELSRSDPLDRQDLPGGGGECARFPFCRGCAGGDEGNSPPAA